MDIINSEVLKSEAPMRIAEQQAIPEFLRFNINVNDILASIRKKKEAENQ